MTNAVYPAWKTALITGLANSTLTGTGTTGLYAVLIDTGVYSYDPTHQFYSSLLGIAAAEQEITAVTTISGTVDGNDIVFPTVTAGPSLEAIVLFRKNTGANTTWRLVCYLDSNVVGLPMTPNGNNINIVWSTLGIFTL